MPRRQRQTRANFVDGSFTGSLVASGTVSISPRRRPAPEPNPAEELRKAETAMRQLERAELYIVSAITLDLPNPTIRRALHLLHGQLLEVHELLRMPHLAT